MKRQPSHSDESKISRRWSRPNGSENYFQILSKKKVSCSVAFFEERISDLYSHDFTYNGWSNNAQLDCRWNCLHPVVSGCFLFKNWSFVLIHPIGTFCLFCMVAISSFML
ncbi:hypothetical protein EG68_06070 [Paragonimus skrjabini miyazakii]|uniref:Uncharacterized protein n=1 Tax=Paragonimus skrjabini miyazakii TaxID=59628 RepID=A0A8S9YPW6_9TREM|nr:hypothetical protein EG68_06070 [Paragonimus skrjabini miyazakii]